jgi:hypothetical protein
MGASDALASRLRDAISEEAEILLADKHTVTGAVNIRQNGERIKVRSTCASGEFAGPAARLWSAA